MSDFTFLVASDLHYFDHQCEPFFGRMVEQMRATDAAFLAVLGDLGEVGTEAELSTMRTILNSVGQPLKVVCGNHDWTTDDSRTTFLKHFPGPTNYTFEHCDWQFIALDSTCGRQWKETAVQEASLAWLDEMLPALDRRRPTVILTHFPLGDGVRYQVTNAADVLRRFTGHNLRYVFNGHYHGNTDLRPNGYPITTTACCSFARRNHDGTDAKGFHVCRTMGQDIVREFVPIK